MGRDVRYGIIGTGMMGLEHIHNLLHLHGAVVTAISDPDEGSRNTGRSAADLSAGAVFEDHRDLLASGRCDAVVIATPNYTHAAILDDVLATELHVLAEKPLCTTVADCRRVTEAAARRDAVSWMALEYRYMAPIARLIHAAHAGEAGRIHQVAIREHRFPFLPKVGDWNRFSKKTGGTLVEKCCHFFDLMSMIIEAEPVRVMASGGQNVNHLDERYADGVPDILDNAYVIVEYGNGARAMLDLCMFAEASKNEQEIVVVGDRGKLEAFVPEGLFRIGRRASGEIESHDIALEGVAYEGMHHGSSYLEHVDFLEAIRSGTPPKISFADGLRAVAMGVAAHRSITERRVVDLDEVM